MGAKRVVVRSRLYTPKKKEYLNNISNINKPTIQSVSKYIFLRLMKLW